MKGVIALALKEMVENKFGQDHWNEALKKAGFDEEPKIFPISNVDDEIVLKIINSVCDVLNVSIEQAADAFGDYWINVYSQRFYSSYYRNVKTAKEFLLKMDSVHVRSTKTIPDAHPPRFDYKWKDDKTLIMTYKSQRNLIVILMGLIKGVGKFYNEKLKIRNLGNNEIEIIFL